jgi:arabinogalactan oligomer/maltooligosaccharide transport system substrate-binding protein
MATALPCAGDLTLPCMADWGDIPAWISSSATIVALTFAAVAAVAARRTYMIESERDRTTAEERRTRDAFARRAQASCVSAWWSEDDGGAYVRNACDSPVYQAYLNVHGSVAVDLVKLDLPVIPPSSQAIFHPVELPAPAQIGLRVSLTFTDSAGVRWQRDRYGRLVQLEPFLRVCADPAVENVLFGFAADMHAAYGVSVEFDTDAVNYGPRGDELRARFSLSIGGTDILVAPHDWVGELVAESALEPIVLPALRQAAFDEWTLDAMSAGGCLYGIPTALDTMALLRNTDLVPHAPASIEDLIKIGTRLQETGRVSQVLAVMVGEKGDPYQIWPLISSGGGWLFGRTRDGAWDPHVIGINRPETVAAFECIRNLGDAGEGILRRGIDYDASGDAFYRGEAAFLLTTSAQAMRAANIGISVAVTAVPPFRTGGPATSFVSVNGMVISRRAPNMAIAQDLVADYLTRPDVILTQRLNLGNVSPLRESDTEHPIADAYARLCRQGMIMPSFPQMADVWRLLGVAEVRLIAGDDAVIVAEQTAAEVAALFPPADRP